MRSRALCHPGVPLVSGGLCAHCHQKSYREANRDRINARRRARGADRSRAMGRTPRASKGSGRDVARLQAWRQARPEAVKAADNRRNAAWWKAHPEAKRAKGHVRRARKLGGGGAGVPAQAWADTLEYFGHVCAYCLRGGEPLEREHLVPLARGGLDEPGNVVPACHRCNARKHVKSLLAFLPVAQQGVSP